MKRAPEVSPIVAGGTILEARDVVLSFGETPALRGANLSVNRGEIVGDVDLALVGGRVFGEFELGPLHHHRRVREGIEPARVIEVQVRLDHQVDVGGLEP